MSADARRSRGRAARQTVIEKKKKAFHRRDARMRINAPREPLDRGPSPHVSCQAKARVPICAPKDRFTRVLAASFTGAPRYTREVFILGSRSSPFSSPSVADTFRPKSKKNPKKNQKKLKRLATSRRRHGVKPVLLGGRRSRFVVWYAHRLSLLTNSLECCRHSKGRRAVPPRRRALEFSRAERKKKQKNEKRVSAPFPSVAAPKRG